jgi:hypothetical protein
MLKPANVESNLSRWQCSEKAPDSIEIIENAPIRIYALWKFDFEGRVFAYRVQYAPESMFRGKRVEMASMTSVFFFDPDGSGKFSLLKYQNGCGNRNLPSFCQNPSQIGLREMRVTRPKNRD